MFQKISSYKVPAVCYICCGENDLRTSELTKVSGKMGLTGNVKRVESIQEVGICAVCDDAKQVADRFQVIPTLFAGAFVVIGLLFGITGKLGLLSDELFSKYINPQFLAVSLAGGAILAFFVLPVFGRLLSAIWLSLFCKRLPISGFKWMRYAAAPYDIVEGCPVFKNPEYQQLYDRENYLAAENRQLAGSAKKFLNYILMAFAILCIGGLAYTLLADRAYKPVHVTTEKANDPKYRNIRKPNANFGPAMRRKHREDPKRKRR